MNSLGRDRSNSRATGRCRQVIRQHPSARGPARDSSDAAATPAASGTERIATGTRSSAGRPKADVSDGERNASVADDGTTRT
ncbi:hypothetical protein C487_09174 [Natrinema pallidum DSM 3751]|uniref:Uncharacterized protein n=1 Tax=Natrinema pallidum DSM 3751 TaxID=1227495 RepID=L9YVN7_9EURY|nr:hypothetical protein C487_09174 [Natrinema pallidum DSM 3751]